MKKNVLNEGDTVNMFYGTDYYSGGLGPCIAIAVVNHDIKEGMIGVLGHYLKIEDRYISQHKYLNQKDIGINKFSSVSGKKNYTTYVSGGEGLNKDGKRKVLDEITNLGYLRENIVTIRNRYNGIAEQETLEILVSDMGEVTFESDHEDLTEFIDLE